MLDIMISKRSRNDWSDSTKKLREKMLPIILIDRHADQIEQTVRNSAIATRPCRSPPGRCRDQQQGSRSCDAQATGAGRITLSPRRPKPCLHKACARRYRVRHGAIIGKSTQWIALLVDQLFNSGIILCQGDSFFATRGRNDSARWRSTLWFAEKRQAGHQTKSNRSCGV